MKNTSIKVIGIGSPFGDDQVGLQVIQKLQNHVQVNSLDKSHLEIYYLDRPGINLLTEMQGADIVILIDAVKSGASVGTLHYYEDEAIFNINNQKISSHGFGVAEALRLGEALNDLPKKIIFYGIEVDCCDYSEVSVKVNAAVDSLLAKIYTRLVALLTEK